MQAIILAAGRGTRMKELTEKMPKPMLMLRGKNLIEHKLDALPSEVDEVIIVVGYLKEKIISHFGNDYAGRKITYVVMDELHGTGKALWLCKKLLKQKFIVLMGDDLYSSRDINECLKHEWAVLAHKKSGEVTGGALVMDKNQKLRDILEGTHSGSEILIYTGLCVLTPKIFDYPLAKLAHKEEYGLPQTLVKAIDDVPIEVVESSFWLQLSNPEDLAGAEKNISLVI